MPVSRRSLLKGMVGVGAAATGLSAVAEAAEPVGPPADAVGMLYDTTLCIGCRACVSACREANGLELDADPLENPLYDAPRQLNDRNKNIIKLFNDGTTSSFIKSQCMHCVDPACVGACMLGALQKREKGIVWWDGDKCVGCRYCQMACPFNIPKFEWQSRNPKIIKCEMCRHLLAKGETPACCEACPRDAVIFGLRSELLVEAKNRLAAHPGRYVDKIYGEHDGGGTQVLYLSHVPFEKLGLPDLGPRSQARLARTVQRTVFKWFVVPVMLFTVVGAAVSRSLPSSTKTKEETES